MADNPETSDLETALWKYIATLESMNQTLLDTVKQCVRVMTPLKELVPDPEGWQAMLDYFNETVERGERVSAKRVLH